MDFSVGGGGFRSQHVEECPDIGPVCDSVAVAPYQHDLEIVTGDLALGVRYGFAPGFGLEALVAWRVNRQEITFRTLEGAPFTPDPPDVHHADRTLSGFADPWLLVAYGRHAGAWSWGARAGASLPVGSTVEDPFALGDLGVPHEHVQLGSGTVQPMVGLGMNRGFDGWTATLSGIARFGVATNGHGYRPGDQVIARAFATSALGVPRATFALGPTLFHETSETWQGHVASEGNLGRTDLYAEGRATWTPPGWGAALGGELRVPLWSEATGAQVDVPVSFRLWLSTTFGESTP